MVSPSLPVQVFWFKTWTHALSRVFWLVSLSCRDVVFRSGPPSSRLGWKCIIEKRSVGFSSVLEPRINRCPFSQEDSRSLYRCRSFSATLLDWRPYSLVVTEGWSCQVNQALQVGKFFFFRRAAISLGTAPLEIPSLDPGSLKKQGQKFWGGLAPQFKNRVIKGRLPI